MTIIGLVSLASENIQRSIVNRNEKKLTDPIDFTKPKISSAPWKDLKEPRNLKADQISCILTVRLDQASIQRGDKKALANEMAEILRKILRQRKFLPPEDKSTEESSSSAARFLCRIELTAANEGNRLKRYWKSDGGFVRAGLQYSLVDPTETPSPIVKRGNIAYVNDMKEASREERSGKGSGRKAILLGLEEMVSLLYDDIVTAKTADPSENLPDLS